MPELPEVETTRNGILPHVVGHVIDAVCIRNARLRYPVPAELPSWLRGQCLLDVRRRGKYLLMPADNGGCLIIHLGMSGHLRIVSRNESPGRHDHIDICFAAGHRLRYCDPRRFGLVLWTFDVPEHHRLLARMGPEPLTAWSGDDLWLHCRGRRQAIKVVLMDVSTVVGVGNIYASESLFRAGIHPQRAAGRISRQRCCRLVAAVRKVLEEAISAGGTSLRDFVSADGRPGYFKQQLQVYGREGQLCRQCESTIRCLRQGGRASFYCPRCQR